MTPNSPNGQTPAHIQRFHWQQEWDSLSVAFQHLRSGRHRPENGRVVRHRQDSLHKKNTTNPADTVRLSLVKVSEERQWQPSRISWTGLRSRHAHRASKV